MKILIRAIGLLLLILPFLPITTLIEAERFAAIFSKINNPTYWSLSIFIVFSICLVAQFLLCNLGIDYKKLLDKLLNPNLLVANQNVRILNEQTVCPAGKTNIPAEQAIKADQAFSTNWLRLIDGTSKPDISIGGWYIRWGKLLLIISFITSTACLFLISTSAYQERALLIDNIIQLFQAKIFASGSMSASVPEPFAFFATQHMLTQNDVWAAQYPPIWSMFLSLGYLFGKPSLIPIVFSIMSFITIVLFANLIYDRKTAVLSAILLTFCPFFLFIGATFSNHIPTLFFLACFCLFYAYWEKYDNNLSLIIASISMGFAIICRPLTGFIVGLIFAIYAFKRILRDKKFGLVLSCLIAFFAVIGVWLVYNQHTTGSALTTGYVKLWGPSHNPGFHESPTGDAHTLLRGISLQLGNLYLLNEFMFESPLPALWIVGLFLFLGRSFSSWDRRLITLSFAIPFIYVFYWHTDAYWGPRYIYSSLLFLIPLSARALIYFFENLDLKIFNSKSRYYNGKAFLLTLIIFCAAAIIYEGFPRRFSVYSLRLSSWKVNLDQIRKDQNIEEGLIFIPVSWGNRIISNLRELRVEAGLIEKSYRNVDHCSLDFLWKEAQKTGMEKEEVESELLRLIALKSDIIKTNQVNKDPTLRLRRDKTLTDECKQELEYDISRPYSNYSPFIVYNHPELSGNIIVARDLKDRNQELISKYPNLPTYVLIEEELVPL